VETKGIILSEYPNANVGIAVVNITEEEAVDQFFEHGITMFGRIDFAVNAAGFSHKATSVVDLSEADYHKSYQVNLLGVSGSIDNYSSSRSLLMRYAIDVSLRACRTSSDASPKALTGL
jgi:NAD(P)-dependent dehydrogenase (short-subunit alcohol dehydrogenase family)